MKLKFRKYWMRDPSRANNKKFYTVGKFGRIGKALIEAIENQGHSIEYYYNRNMMTYRGMEVMIKATCYPALEVIKVQIGSSVRHYQFKVV